MGAISSPLLVACMDGAVAILHASSTEAPKWSEIVLVAEKPAAIGFIDGHSFLLEGCGLPHMIHVHVAPSMCVVPSSQGEYSKHYLF